ncbi:MAG: hypothetical protein HDT24_04475 [Ruminococcus sp.]|nr:hypothetical protein [Ruminococcus sp.]
MKKQNLTPDQWLRFRLITAFKGDVIQAEVAFEYIKGNPEASENYRNYRAWVDECYRCYQENGFKGKVFQP